VQRGRVPPRVAAEQGDVAAVLVEQAEQNADRGGLARAVRAEEGMHLADGDRQVKAVKRRCLAEELAVARAPR